MYTHDLYRTYEELKQLFPKSSWFPATPNLYRTYEELKLDVVVYAQNIDQSHLYRTYEELKLLRVFDLHGKYLYLYRTYEELKPSITSASTRSLSFNLYRTYEELKLRNKTRGQKWVWRFVSYLWGIETNDDKRERKWWQICIVPMRNWNREKGMRTWTSWRICIVPMRNWNIRKLNLSRTRREFVSYLWGIETVNTSCFVDMSASNLYRTYEELKLSPFPLVLTCDTLICIVPMRNWNCMWPTGNRHGNAWDLYRTYEELKQLFPKSSW